VDRLRTRRPSGAGNAEAAIKRVVRRYRPLEFVEAAFALAPNQRLASRLHHLMIGNLVPESSEVPFFKAQNASSRASP